MAQRHGRGNSRGSGASGAGSRAGGSRAGGPRSAGSRPDGRRADPARAESPDTARHDTGPRPRPAGRDNAAQRARLRELIEPVVEGAGYDLDGLSLSRAGRRHLVRLTVDGDGGVNLDAVADISRKVSAALDAVEEAGEELFAGEYELQVSSPGIDRPLSLPRHWRRNAGRLAQVRVGERQVTGRIVSADDTTVVLDVDGERREIPFTELGPGRIQIEYKRLAALSDAEFDELTEPVADGAGEDDVTDDGEDLGDEAADDEDETDHDALTGGEEEEEDEE